MSGKVCEIIIRGNLAQSYARTFAVQSQQVVAASNDAIATAQSLCDLGTTTYDGKEVMTDDQQLRATQVMKVFNDKAAPIAAGTRVCTHKEVLALLLAFNADGAALLADVLANTEVPA